MILLILVSNLESYNPPIHAPPFREEENAAEFNDSLQLFYNYMVLITPAIKLSRLSKIRC